ncbi:MAG TPA: site-specific integrase, partial [Bacteroidia bacterium]|nr:site-specific integrase [Bacteroidia bacterium]
MDWKSALNGFKGYLRLEKSLSENTLEAYFHDVQLLHKFLEERKYEIGPDKVKFSQLQEFLAWV